MINIELKDEEWQLDYIDHDRHIVRAIVIDDAENFYFVRVDRNDDFADGILIETAGGGIEPGETTAEALKRELMEELGAEVEVICKLGVVSDYYNLIHRHNINNYFLCRLKSLGNTHLTDEEINDFHLSTLKMSYQEAVKEYEKCSDIKLGRLIAKRELPMLAHAKSIIDSNKI